jgi:hypothetical protein
MAALKIFYDLYKQDQNAYYPTLKGLDIDGRTFPFIVKGSTRGSRDWVEHTRGKGFRITPKGVAAWIAWDQTDIFRKAPATHFAKSIRGLAGLDGEFKIPKEGGEPIRKRGARIYRFEQMRRKSA